MAVSRAQDIVIKVFLEALPDGNLYARIDHNAREDLVFAFYVFRNEKRIHVQWYGKSPELCFNCGGQPGSYRVVGFAKTPENALKQEKSSPIFVFPTRVTKEEFPVVEANDVFYELEGARWNFPVLCYPNSKKRLFVLMSSGIDRSRISLPAFNRWTWAQKGVFPGNVLCIADPTLSLDSDMGLGWYMGTSERDPMDDLVEFVGEYIRRSKIPAQEVVVWGSSAGGFAALALASRIDGATAVAINAQTDPLSYHIPGQVDLVKSVCFEGAAEADIRREFADRVDMIKRWANSGSSRAVLIQNRLDEHHYFEHFTPFWRSLDGVISDGWANSGRHLAWVYEDVKGHVAESEDMVVDILGRIGMGAADLEHEPLQLAK